MSWNEGERKIRIGVDFDDTFTADRVLWRDFMRRASARGHKIVCVSCRPDDEENRAEMSVQLPAFVPLFLTSGAPKEWFMREQGLPVDVWIDDYPDCIKNGR